MVTTRDSPISKKYHFYSTKVFQRTFFSELVTVYKLYLVDRWTDLGILGYTDADMITMYLNLRYLMNISVSTKNTLMFGT